MQEGFCNVPQQSNVKSYLRVRFWCWLTSYNATTSQNPLCEPSESPSSAGHAPHDSDRTDAKFPLHNIRQHWTATT